MGQLIEALTAHLRKRGVSIHLKTAAPPPHPQEWRVLCTSVRDAARLLSEPAPQASQTLSRVEMLPLVTATAFYPAEESRRPGFGILFPRNEGFRALGVLFNANIFEGRAGDHSETWILGGAEDRAVVDLTDEQLSDQIDSDRRRLYRRDSPPLERHITRWPEALPHYTVDLESLLQGPLPLPPRTYLVGNYLGGLGLAKILERAHRVVRDLTPAYRRAD
jgi:oxygen-dependent protoporphyrinogen oxidase